MFLGKGTKGTHLIIVYSWSASLLQVCTDMLMKRTGLGAPLHI